jgi:cytidyltransferase-like protein
MVIGFFFTNICNFILYILYIMSDQKKIKKIGYVDMVGDLFHCGHIRLLKHVHDLGYHVVAGIHSDEAVESYKRAPILTMPERIEIISACKYVDDVIPNAPLIITEHFINNHRIDMCYHGHSLEEHEQLKKLEYKDPVKLHKFTRTEYTVGISTTDIIARILSMK